MRFAKPRAFAQSDSIPGHPAARVTADFTSKFDRVTRRVEPLIRRAARNNCPTATRPVPRTLRSVRGTSGKVSSAARLSESGGSITTGNMSEQGLSDFALADAAGGWMRMLRCSVARLSHIVRRLARDEEALMLDVGRTRTASTILIPVFAIMVLAAGTWFVRHAGAGSVCEVECVPRVRPVGVSPLFDEKSVVSDAQLSRVFSSPSLAAAFRSGDSSSELVVELSHWVCREKRDLARCLATAGWLGLTTDTVLQTADGGRSISTLLRQLRREFRLRTPSLEQHPCAESLLAFAFYMPDTRHWLDAEELPVTFDMLVARVLKQESWCDAIDERETTLGRDALAELDRLWSLAVVLRIDDQQSLLSERTRSLIVDRLRLATRQWCETQRDDGSWSEHGQGEAASRTAVQSESDARLLITARTLTWWGLCPHEALPPFEVRVRAARWLCDQFEAGDAASNLRSIVPRLDVIHHRSVAVPTAVASARQAALSDAAQALALWRGRTTAAAFREEQLHRHSRRSGGVPADRVAVEPGRLNQPNLE